MLLFGLVFVLFYIRLSGLFCKKLLNAWADICIIKGTLMQILKSPSIFVFLEKQYPENLALLRFFPICKNGFPITSEIDPDKAFVSETIA